MKDNDKCDTLKCMSNIVKNSHCVSIMSSEQGMKDVNKDDNAMNDSITAATTTTTKQQ